MMIEASSFISRVPHGKILDATSTVKVDTVAHVDQVAPKTTPNNSTHTYTQGVLPSLLTYYRPSSTALATQRLPFSSHPIPQLSQKYS